MIKRSLSFLQLKLEAILGLFLFLFLFSGCSRDQGLPIAHSGYPSKIGKIMEANCAVPGCHTTKSKDGAAGLDLSTWDHMFEGARNGSSVIPFRADQSYLMYFINTYEDLGVHLLPTMPNNKPALSHDDVVTIRDWINAGATDNNGFVKFSDNATRKKFYVTNQACNLVTVFDAETRLPMRVVNVGNAENISPHMVRVSPDGKYWYVVFYSGNAIEKYDASTDHIVSRIPITSASVPISGSWNTMCISADSKSAYAIDWEANGIVAFFDLEHNTNPITYQGSGLYTFPHGSVLNHAGNTLYITGQTGNYIYKEDVTDPFNFNFPQQIVLQTGATPNSTSLYDAHEIAFSPDEAFYFVTCQKSNEVRVMQTSNDSLVAVIPVGIYPLEISVSKTMPYLFVSCQEDTIQFPSSRGLISVINYETHQWVKNIFTGWQPHGLAVDDNRHLVYIANRNATTTGPAPHHSGTCGGRNGYVTAIDMNTLELLPGFKTEVNVNPYSVAVRN